MITISEATARDFKTIQEIVHITWPHTYGGIISDAQIAYMLDLMYSEGALSENLNQKKHRFLLATENSDCLGFASFEHNYNNEKGTHLHKLYVLPEAQGLGVGKLLMDAVENSAKENHSIFISLFVNKFNKAIAFYQKNDFKIVSEVCLEIGQGYVMDDYKMEKQL
ncbi:GNAT family N-acetyltransferase [Flavobacterium psychrotolerans]|uniref:GNAT family N-acetyltransferase n=1 Tax=Flavobacterium psychrotolerans TaxID=2169410 RepID=A0A2U1JLM7_9FLAO|nr:GNAT family N-acetyltransferase [Flavobacterium psychrotolerans]PWA05905.1 GNAT family N-acetyltransferase [Flavobacterium psychrotolerans]